MGEITQAVGLSHNRQHMYLPQRTQRKPNSLFAVQENLKPLLPAQEQEGQDKFLQLYDQIAGQFCSQKQQGTNIKGGLVIW